MYILSLIICTSLSLSYACLIFYIVRQWKTQSVVKAPESFNPQTKFSVIIAARNEEQNIVETISSVLACNYPRDLFELIVINDHSTDDTLNILSSKDDDRLSIVNLNTETGKKAALSKGIDQAMFSHIVVTDADCIVPSNWLINMAYLFKESKAEFVVGPVLISDSSNLCTAFQSLDTLGTTGVTQAGIQSDRWYMANGANMAFNKETFLENSGFKGNENWASGDDMFLVERFSQLGQVAYLKTSNAVITKAERSWPELYRQRIRWATKNKSYNHQGVRNTLGIVFLFNFCLVLNFVLAILFGSKWLAIALTMMFVKLLVDSLYLHRLASFYDRREALDRYFGSSLIYIIYIVGVGLASLFVKKYTWKERRVQ